MEEGTRRDAEFLNLLLDIGDIRRNVQANKASIARVSTFFGDRSVEFRDRITALETRYFETLDDFADVERLIGRPDSAAPEAS